MEGVHRCHDRCARGGPAPARRRLRCRHRCRRVRPPRAGERPTPPHALAPCAPAQRMQPYLAEKEYFIRRWNQRVDIEEQRPTHHSNCDDCAAFDQRQDMLVGLQGEDAERARTALHAERSAHDNGVLTEQRRAHRPSLPAAPALHLPSVHRPFTAPAPPCSAPPFYAHVVNWRACALSEPAAVFSHRSLPQLRLRA